MSVFSDSLKFDLDEYLDSLDERYNEAVGLEDDSSIDKISVIKDKLSPHLRDVIEQSLGLEGDELRSAAMCIEDSLVSYCALSGCSQSDLTVGVEEDSTEEEIKIGLQCVLSKLDV